MFICSYLQLLWDTYRYIYRVIFPDVLLLLRSFEQQNAIGHRSLKSIRNRQFRHSLYPLDGQFLDKPYSSREKKRRKENRGSLRVEIYLHLSRSITVDGRFGRHQQRRHCQPTSPVPIKSPSSSLRNWYRETKTPIPGVYFACYVYLYTRSIRAYSMTGFRVYVSYVLALAHLYVHAAPVLEVLIDRCRSLHGWSQLNTAILRTNVGLLCRIKITVLGR